MEDEKPAVRPKAWRNSDLSPKQARRQGLCGRCGGNGQFTQTVKGKLTVVPCTDCNRSGRG